MLIGSTFIILLIGMDRLAKYVAVHYLKPIRSISLINGVFDLTFVENRGAAFGFFQGGRWYLVILTLIMLAGLGYYYYSFTKNQQKTQIAMRAALILIISGACGNLIDRLFIGYVIDFFHFKMIDFPVFNFADIFIVTGSLLFAVLALFYDTRTEADGNKNSDCGSV